MKRREFLLSGGGWTVACFSAIASLGFVSENSNDIKLYKILSIRCNGCRKCLPRCKQKALVFSNNKVIIDSDKCNGCGDCVRSCRRQAIVLVA